MLIKMASHLFDDSLGLRKEITIHISIIILSSLLILAAFFIASESFWLSSNWLPIAPLIGLLIIEAIYFIVYGYKVLGGRRTEHKIILYYNLILYGALLLRIATFVLILFYQWMLPIAITLYFLSNLIPLLYLWQKADDEFIPIQSENSSLTKIEKIVSQFGISKREQEVIKQISLGKTNQQIADELFISLQTVKDHTHRIYRKTGVNSRMKLITLLGK